MTKRKEKFELLVDSSNKQHVVGVFGGYFIPITKHIVVDGFNLQPGFAVHLDSITETLLCASGWTMQDHLFVYRKDRDGEWVGNWLNLQDDSFAKQLQKTEELAEMLILTPEVETGEVQVYYEDGATEFFYPTCVPGVYWVHRNYEEPKIDTMSYSKWFFFHGAGFEQRQETSAYVVIQHNADAPF